MFNVALMRFSILHCHSPGWRHWHSWDGALLHRFAAGVFLPLYTLISICMWVSRSPGITPWPSKDSWLSRLPLCSSLLSCRRTSLVGTQHKLLVSRTSGDYVSANPFDYCEWTGLFLLAAFLNKLSYYSTPVFHLLRTVFNPLSAGFFFFLCVLFYPFSISYGAFSAALGLNPFLLIFFIALLLIALQVSTI